MSSLFHVLFARISTASVDSIDLFLATRKGAFFHA